MEGGGDSTLLLAFQEARREHQAERERRQWQADRRCVLEQCPELSPAELEVHTREYAARRQRRIETFLEHVRARDRALLEQACPDSCV